MALQQTADVNELKSLGISILNTPTAGGVKDSATVIVVGVPRSGTSMVASTLHKLGVFMGNRTDKAVFEDVEIASAIESSDKKQLKSLIELRNREHAIWAFKRPNVFNLIDKHLPLFRNPRFVVVFRDPAAIAKRNEISMHRDFLSELRTANEQTGKLVKFVSRLKLPAMVVSYEKALLNPEPFIDALVDFCGIDANEQQRGKAAGVIENGPERYLFSARAKYEGCLEDVSNGKARGWVRRIGRDTPLTVVITHDGKEVGRGKADLHRTDLETRKGTGNTCGFEIALKKRSPNCRLWGLWIVLRSPWRGFRSGCEERGFPI